MALTLRETMWTEGSVLSHGPSKPQLTQGPLHKDQCSTRPGARGISPSTHLVHFGEAIVGVPNLGSPPRALVSAFFMGAQPLE